MPGPHQPPQPTPGHPRHDRPADAENTALVLSLGEVDGRMLATVGGKAANLGELIGAGLPVPPGFCVTTDAYALAARNAALEDLPAGPATGLPTGSAQDAPGPVQDTTGPAARAALARERLLEAPLPPEVAAAVTEAYRGLGEDQPVAVRSSASAEDLPDASFAGQMETYLNVVGVPAVLDAVRRCWASLWTDRAVVYRATHDIGDDTVRLAVVVQRMVEAEVSGVLFTADPLTGRRGRAVIDAGPGLGEAIVSGAVNPDHFVVDPGTGEVLSRRLGDKQLAVRSLPGGGVEHVAAGEASGNDFCITGARLAELARLGARVEAHYGAPQDIEWALDAAGTLWLTQARPITTLYPLPVSSPEDAAALRVYFSANVAQGVMQPLTPMGVAALRILITNASARLGYVWGDLSRPGAVQEIGHRLYFDITPALRNPRIRDRLPRGLDLMERRSATVLRHLLDDPRLAPLPPAPRRTTARRVTKALWRNRVPQQIVSALLRPETARARLRRAEERLRATGRGGASGPTGSAADRLDAVERLLADEAPVIFGMALPNILPGFAALGVAAKLLGPRASGTELQTVLRGLPHNPTTRMDLELWQLAERLRADPEASRLLTETPPEELAARLVRRDRLPEALRDGLRHFLDRYGHRGVAEIDLGLPHWADDPTYLCGVLAGYLRLQDDTRAPDAQFRRSETQAELMVEDLAGRLAGGRLGRARSGLARACLNRARELAGLREVPKNLMVLTLVSVRRELLDVGVELVRARRLERAEDVFFVDFAEARRGLGGEDLRPLVQERRAGYDREMRRRHVPRVLLSDGTDAETDLEASAVADLSLGTAGDGFLSGAAASPGTVTARARVVLDPTSARLEPGEILVAPSTDPGWTPLFLTAAGLVMEMGGANSHGAVVAREYGIPAVVGVRDAIRRITTGQWITVDGSAGRVVLDPATAQDPGQQLLDENVR